MVKTFGWLSGRLLRLLSRSAVDTALGAAVDTVPRVSQREITHVFTVSPPVTIYVSGRDCRVTVRRAPDRKVAVMANVHRSFGIELAAEQNADGIYIVARQKRVVGRLSRADFMLSVPEGCDLVFNLTPGDIVLEQVEGLIELPSLDVLVVPTPQDAPPPLA